jgi:26S proteasome regulatory subunit N1
MSNFSISINLYISPGDAEAAQTESVEPIVHDAEVEKMECMAQSAAVLGIGLVAMGEQVGSEMVQRSMQHLLQYGEPPIRRTIPLATALLNVSKPDYAIVDTLSRLSHDPDAETSINAILALGVISAGTNNSRVAGMLRQLSEFYHREAQHLFVVRIAQGLLHMAKGLITLHPFHSDRLLLSKPALGGLLVVLHACFEPKVCTKYFASKDISVQNIQSVRISQYKNIQSVRYSSTKIQSVKIFQYL